jgi:hypothetical protein
VIWDTDLTDEHGKNDEINSPQSHREGEENRGRNGLK